MKLRHYLSCYGPQFVRGLGLLSTRHAHNVDRYIRAIWPIPDYFAVVKHDGKEARPSVVEIFVWGAIAVAWVSMILLLFVVHISLLIWAGIAIILSACAPFALMLVAISAAWMLDRSKRLYKT